MKYQLNSSTEVTEAYSKVIIKLEASCKLSDQLIELESSQIIATYLDIVFKKVELSKTPYAKKIVRELLVFVKSERYLNSSNIGLRVALDSLILNLEDLVTNLKGLENLERAVPIQEL
jgi:hypothetical protein